MLDLSIRQQLQEVFAKLSGEVTLRVAPSSRSDQGELLEILSDIASAANSDKIRVEVGQGHPRTDAPYFEVVNAGGKAGVAFRGVPGGHEFSSLVLAILHSDGKGKQPDAGMVRRIRALKGPIRLKTYVSLSCETCPEVVQALNLMATLHSDFHHETIDGAVVPEEVEALGIQGVPSVIHDGKLIHSGRMELIGLLQLLEKVFGRSDSAVDSATVASSSAAAREHLNLGEFDVVVIGGGPAGASAAIYSARKGLKVALIAERLGGQLQETKSIENMISVPYTEGVKLAAQLADHLARYPVRVLENRIVQSIESGEARVKRLELEGGEFLFSSAVIIATGAKWRRLGIPGEDEYIGRGVAFCAHCDGPFYKGKRVAVIGGGNSGVEAAIDLAGIAEKVTLLEFSERLKADDVLIEKLKALPNVKVLMSAKSTRILGDGKKVTGLEFEDMSKMELATLELDGVFVQIGLLPNSRFVKGLVETTPFGEIVVDVKGRTNVAGIYAAGDVTTVPFKQIVIAMGDGAKVALTAFEDRMRAA